MCRTSTYTLKPCTLDKQRGERKVGTRMLCSSQLAGVCSDVAIDNGLQPRAVDRDASRDDRTISGIILPMCVRVCVRVRVRACNTCNASCR